MSALDDAVAALMREAAERAILPRWRKLAAHEIVSKAAKDAELPDVVTIADREAEAILAEGLARLMPEAAVVGEEAAHADPAVFDHLARGLCWVIDPLDGTNNFAIGEAPFGILIALADRGVTQAGWLHDGLSGRQCRAELGKGAWVGGERVIARTTDQNPPLLANSLVYMNAAKRAAVQAHVAQHYTLIDIPRCAAEQYPRLVLGQTDLAIFERTLPWDHAAGVLFVNEAGGKAARPDGSAYRLDDHARPGLIGAASEALWGELAERLNALAA